MRKREWRRLDHGKLSCLAVLLAVVCLPPLAGCQDPLITEDQIRSPFHRYDRVRNQDADTFVRDEFGRARPNVAARLAPK